MPQTRAAVTLRALRSKRPYQPARTTSWLCGTCDTRSIRTQRNKCGQHTSPILCYGTGMAAVARTFCGSSERQFKDYDLNTGTDVLSE
jgi:hypothetical protein